MSKYTYNALTQLVDLYLISDEENTPVMGCWNAGRRWQLFEKFAYALFVDQS